MFGTWTTSNTTQPGSGDSLRHSSKDLWITLSSPCNPRVTFDVLELLFGARGAEGAFIIVDKQSTTLLDCRHRTAIDGPEDTRTAAQRLGSNNEDGDWD